MKKLVVTTLAILATASVQAEVFRSRVHGLEEGFVKFTNGRVAFLDTRSVNLMPSDYVEAHVDDFDSSLRSFTILNDEKEYLNKNLSFAFNENPEPIARSEFEPTIVPNMAEIQNIWNRSNPYWKRISECSDRAHIWAHDEFKRTGTKSEKIFIFLTASYIDSVRFKWWFHVAPMYTVNDNGTLKKIVMDYRYTDRPLSIKEFTDELVFTKRSCKVTTRFSEYDVNPQTENCYLIFESMHYRLPAELHTTELKGLYKTTTTDAELKMVFNMAFMKKARE